MIEDRWIQTYTGRKFSYVNPHPDSVHLIDVAYALSNINRYTGHATTPISVAQHSLLVETILSGWGEPSIVCLKGLLHDAHEAYVGDIATPIKQVVPEFRDFEDRIWAVVAEHFGIPADLPEVVKKADLAALATERLYRMLPPPEPWAHIVEAAEPVPEAWKKLEPYGPAGLAFIKRAHHLAIVTGLNWPEFEDYSTLTMQTLRMALGTMEPITVQKPQGAVCR